MGQEYALDCSLARDVARELDEFTLSYIEAMLWLMTDDDGQSLDYLGLHDIAPEAIESIKADCARFQQAWICTLSLAGSDAQNGHDYFLTRNHHGCGFWDREYADGIGDALTDAAHAEGSQDAYLGDDGLVYVA